MKNLFLTLIALTTVVITSCASTNNAVAATGQEEENVTVTGKITALTNGKDGYTAVLQSADNKTYTATISRINLQKTGSEFKRFEEDETITVTGSVWVDTEGTTYITVSELH